MADDIIENQEGGNEDEPEGKKYSSEDIERIVKRRLRNMDAEHEGMRAKMEEMQRMLDERSEPTEEKEAAEESLNEPLTREALNDALEKNRKVQMEEMQEAQLKNAVTHHINNVGKMKNEDPKFKKLAEESSLGVPDEVGIYLSNNLDHDTSKKLFKELLTNETSNLKMQNAFLTGNFDKWLNQMLSHQTESKESPSPSPDLTSQNSGGVEGGRDDNIMSYLGTL